MTQTDFRVVVDPVVGHRRLDPLPTPGELGAFYESRYYDLVRRGGRAPEIRRLVAGGPDADRERAWLAATLWSDLAHLIARHAPGRRVLDVGSGSGDFLAALVEGGFDAIGTEPSVDATAIARARGLAVHPCTLAALAARPGAPVVDAVTFLNVLEHVPDPATQVAIAASLLAPGGLVCVRVPNDFNALQLAAQAARGHDAYWVATPDHVSYFDFPSLRALLDGAGLDLVHAQGDFPMELFLLMGDDYVHEPAVGEACHARRVAFEAAVPAETRRALYEALASVGLGRNALVVGRKRAT